MNIAAIMPVRNEQWVLGLSARAALEWCDQLVCLLHKSVDRSREILEQIGRETGRVRIMSTDDEQWREMEHRQSLVSAARNYAATHIALVDADEVICADSLPRIRESAGALRVGECLNVNMYCMWRGIHQYRTDPGSVWSGRHDLALVFRDAGALSFAAKDGYQHHARAPRNAKLVVDQSLGVMHLQFADWRRLTAKHALYKVRERIDYPAKPVDQIERMYNLALNERGLDTKWSPRQWFERYQEKDWMTLVDFADTPWQEEEARRLFATRDPQYFQGLNLFGVCQFGRDPVEVIKQQSAEGMPGPTVKIPNPRDRQ